MQLNETRHTFVYNFHRMEILKQKIQRKKKRYLNGQTRKSWCGYRQISWISKCQV